MRQMPETESVDLAKRSGGSLWKELYSISMYSAKDRDEEQFIQFRRNRGIGFASFTNNDRIVVVRDRDGEYVAYPMPVRRDEISDSSGNGNEMVTRLTIGDPGGIAYGAVRNRDGRMGNASVSVRMMTEGGSDRYDEVRLFSAWAGWDQSILDYVFALPEWNRAYLPLAGRLRFILRDLTPPDWDVELSPNGIDLYCLQLSKGRGGLNNRLSCILPNHGLWSAEMQLSHAGFRPTPKTEIGTGRKASYVREAGVAYVIVRSGSSFRMYTSEEAAKAGVEFDSEDASLALSASPSVVRECWSRLKFSSRYLLGNRIDFCDADGIDYSFKVGAISYNGTSLSVDLRSYSQLQWRFPFRTMLKGICPWEFKGCECGYRGPDETCDHTIPACLAKGNIARIGCFPGCGVGGLAR